MTRSILTTIGAVAFGMVLASAPCAGAQDEDPIGTACVADKLKASGKQCQCLHKEMRKAAITGQVADFAKCDAKYEADIDKAIVKATTRGGMCPTAATAADLGPVLHVAADTVATAVAITAPSGQACDDQNRRAQYTGKYNTARRCVPKDANAECHENPNKSNLEAKIASELSCPRERCQQGDPGCKPKVTLLNGTITKVTTKSGSEFCCLGDLNSGASSLFDLRCTLCADPS